MRNKKKELIHKNPWNIHWPENTSTIPLTSSVWFLLAESLYNNV